LQQQLELEILEAENKTIEIVEYVVEDTENNKSVDWRISKKEW
jgi:hypothetical protein